MTTTLVACRRCLQSKPQEEMRKTKNRWPVCKVCHAAYQRARRIARGDEWRAWNRERTMRYRRAHGVLPKPPKLTPEECRARVRARYAARRAAKGILPRVLLTPEQRRERIRHHNRLYQQRHPERVRAQKQAWRSKNRARLREYHRKRREAKAALALTLGTAVRKP